MLVHHLLEESARRCPDRAALVCGERRRSYAELNSEADALAGALSARRIGRGDRVALYIDNTAEAVTGIFGALKAGATFSLLNPSTKLNKLLTILNNFRATALIVDQPRAALVNAILSSVPSLRYVVAVASAIPAELQTDSRVQRWSDAMAARIPHPYIAISKDDLAMVIYTSGSTGVAKGVMAAHANVMAATTSINAYLRNTQDDTIINVLPLSFDYGLYQLFLAFQVGACVILERSFAYPAHVLQRIRQEGVTGFPVVPTILSLLLHGQRDALDLPSLRYITNTGAALPAAHIARIRELLPHVQLFSMYGLTECKRVSYLPPHELDRRPTSIGLPIPNTEVFIVDAEGQRVADGEVGELVVRGPHVMRGYWADPQETAKRFRPGPMPGETVLYTGDLVRRDSDGFLYFVGRMDDIIKSRGEKVSPKEVEAVVYGLDGVVDAAVIGVPDDVLGSAIALFVSLAPGSTLTPRQIQAHCQKQLENFMVPKVIEVWPSLPKSPQGKLDKRAIAERFQSCRARQAAVPGKELP